MSTKEERHKRAQKWAKATGSSPGRSEYMEAYLYGYFNHFMSSSRPLSASIFEQLEELEDQLAAIIDKLDKWGRGSPSVRTTPANLAETIDKILEADMRQDGESQDRIKALKTQHTQREQEVRKLVESMRRIIEVRGERDKVLIVAEAALTPFPPKVSSGQSKGNYCSVCYGLPEPAAHCSHCNRTGIEPESKDE